MAKADSPSSTQFPEQFYRDPVGLDRYVVQEKVLFEWVAPSKIEKMHQKSEMVQYLLVIILVFLILLLLNDVLPAILFLTVAFVWLLLLVSKPTFLRCQITTIGIKVDDQYYYWQDLTQFWVETKANTQILYLRHLTSSIRYVKLIIQPTDEAEIKTIIGKYLLYKKPKQTLYQKTMDQLIDKLPFRLDLL